MTKRIIASSYLACCLIITCLSACDHVFHGKKKPLAVKGTVDLRGWDFEKDGPMSLDGEWEFSWGQIKGPADFAKPANQKKPDYISVPSLWTSHRIDGVSLPGKGRATYRLRIISGTDKTEKSLCIRRIYSAYRLLINGKLTDARGKFEDNPESREDYIFIHNKRYSSLALKEGVNEIIIQMFNTEYESGGIDRSILMEDRVITERNKSRQYTLSMIVFGMLLFASIYNIVLYYFRRQEMAALFFGFACLSMAINTINHHYPVLSGNFSFPGNPYLINYLTIIISMLLCILTIKHLFPDECSKLSIRLSQGITIVFMLQLFFVRFKTAELLMRFFFLSIVLFITYFFYVLIKAIVKRRNDALLFFIGFTPMFIGAINDVLYALWIINTANIAQYGLIILCITTTIVISRRFARALRTVEKLSEDLAGKNIALQKMDVLKDQFLASTSHELRTPLNGMIGLSDSMLEGSAGILSPKAQENLSLISSSGHRLAGMVNDLLDMAKIQDEGLNLNPRPVDLHPLAEAVVKLSLPLAAGKQLKIVNEIEPGLPPAHADEDRIRQVLYNLVGNAVKFTARGTVAISACMTDRSDAGDGADSEKMIEISVSDTGIGIPPEHRNTIFEPYRQIDGGDTRRYPGIGLGLAIAKQIVELHNGTIGVARGRSGGSVFTFTLPVSRGGFTASRNSDITGDMEDIQVLDKKYGDVFQGKPVILVVDDDPVNVKIIFDFFESKGCVVKSAFDGPSALDIIGGDESVDLVLLDIMMPAMSGYEVCRRIREKRNPQDLPVMMLTAKNMMSDMDDAFNAGANDFIVKPFRLDELRARVSSMLRMKDVRMPSTGSVTVRDRNRAYSLKFGEIVFITSHAKSCVIHTEERDIELPVLMKEIVDRLPPDIFVRIHKQHVVNINLVESVSHVLSGRYKVRLRHEETELPVGAAFLDSLRKKYETGEP